MKKGRMAVILVLLASIMVLLAYVLSVVLEGGPIFEQPTTSTATTTVTTETTEDLEARRAAEREALEKHIRENTVYVDAGIRVFNDRELSKEIFITDRKMSFYSLGLEDGHYEVKRSYDDAETFGFIPEASVKKSLKEFIAAPEEDCEYDYIRTIPDFPENPRIKARALYLSISTTTGSGFDHILDVVENTELNSLVIDIKDDSEELLFESDAAAKYNPEANRHARLKKAQLAPIIKKAKDKGIYLIARIVTFKSPIYSEQNRDGIITYAGTDTPFTEDGVLLWTSPMDRNLWEYNIGLGEEAADLGFNEIQYDYVRFPTVPLTKEFYYKDLGTHSKTYAIQSFLRYAGERLHAKKVYLAADIFGWAATAVDDVQIGQHWEAMTNVVDYMCPMIYPSHYGEWNFGIQYPDTQPYETVLAATQDCIDRNGNVTNPAILRPWIQHFTASYIYYQGLQYIEYGREEIKAQIRALKEKGIEEYLLWNPSNDYEIDVLK
ncbi:MAG: putative glycoside hydrolase [Bacillota bacterium]|nr:putative glycoside hydrolase [Bacillota bacterium]